MYVLSVAITMSSIASQMDQRAVVADASLQSLDASFTCQPLSGGVLITFVVPLVNANGTGAPYNPYKFTITFDTNMNPPGARISGHLEHF